MKQKMKKIISWLLCLVLAVQLAPIAMAAEVASGSTGEVSWSLNDSGILTLSGYGSTGDYTDPSETPWYAYGDQIEIVVIESGVTRIGSYAFAGCANLQEVTVPETVLYTGYGAFADSGLKLLYVYSRGMKFEQSDYNDNITVPGECIIYGYEGSDAEYYCWRNGRNFVEITEGKLISLDSGSSTYPLTFGEGEDLTADLIKASSAEDGSDGSILLDYTLTLDAAQLQQVHNTMQEDRADMIGDNYSNDGRFDIEVYFSFQEYDENAWGFGGGASYSYAETDLDGNATNNYHRWYTYTDREDGILKLTGNGTQLTIQINATVKELYEAAQRIEGNDGSDGKGMHDNRVSNIYLRVSAWGRTYYSGYGGGIYENKSTYIDSVHQSINDAHRRNLFVPCHDVITFDTLYPVSTETFDTSAGYYEPVKREYSWRYQLSRMGEYDENLGRSWGDILWNAETDGLYLEENNGIRYGGLRGTYEAGENNDFSLRKLMNEENTSFLESLMGLQPDGYGGPFHMELECVATLTYADGQVFQMSQRASHECTMLVGLCPHTCSICGLCTAEERLACNSLGGGQDTVEGERANQCRCEAPEMEANCTLIPEDQVGVIDETFIGNVKVRVEDVEPVGKSPYVQKITRKLLHTSIINLFEITVYDEWGNPYIPNQWGGEEEKLTLTVPVDKEWAELAFEAGDAELYHIDMNGNYERIPVTYDSASGTITFTGTRFSPYALVQTAGFYGRKALEKLPNSEGLLYAYEQLAKGVEVAQEVITVYDGVHPVSREEFDTVMSAYLRDYVAHFWCNDTYKLGGTMDCIQVVKPSYALTGAELQAAMDKFEEMTQEILAGIDSGMDDYERELYVHDQITYRIKYDMSNPNCHNAYGGLVEGRAVCDGYSEAFGYLLQRLGIQTFQVLGSGVNPNNGKAEKHSWMYVRIKGKYYHVDTTWNSQKDEVFHMYFNQSDAVMFEDHIVDPVNYDLPVCTSENDFYFLKNDEKKLESYSVDEISQLLKDNGNKTHVYIPGDVNTFVPWLQANAGEVFQELGVSGSLTCLRLAREFLLQITPPGGKLSGTVNSFGNASDYIKVKLSRNGAAVATRTIAGNSATFNFGTVDSGTYTLEIIKDGHFVETRTVTLSGSDVTLDVTLTQKGDINGDGKMNNKDVMILMQCFANWPVSVEERMRDVNGDGKQNNKDVMILMQFLAGWDVTIYPGS